MFSNYLKVIIRNFISDRMYTSINVLGLVMGLAACLIIAQYVQFEMSFDKGLKDKDKIYFSYLHSESWDQDDHCDPALAPFLRQTMPEVEEAIRLFPFSTAQVDLILHRDDVKDPLYSKVDNAYFADPGILNLFSIQMLEGDARSALMEPTSMVITRALADKFFPHESALNRTLSVPVPNGRQPVRITGICENPPTNSSFQFDALFPMSLFNYQNQLDQLWAWAVFPTFLRLNEASNVQVLEQKINQAVIGKFKNPDGKPDAAVSYHLVPFADFHFFQMKNHSVKTPVRFSGDKKLIKFIIIIAALILAVSWANYISLTTARAIRRAKEVGLRKINGANRPTLVFQFLVEFFSLNLISMLMAITIAQIAFPIFAQAIGSESRWIFWSEPYFWLSALMFLVVSTLSAGIYPAFFMSRYKPSTVLKGNFATSAKGNALRKALVFAQFTFSVCLLVSIYVIERQLHYLQSQDLGMSPDQVLGINTFETGTIDVSRALQRMRAGLQNLTGVVNTSGAQYSPGDQTGRKQHFFRKSDPKRELGIRINQVSSGFFETMKIDFLYGRDFNENPKADTDKAIINKKAALELGFADPASALGEWVVYDKMGPYEFQIIGVIEDCTESTKILNSEELYFHRLVDGAAHGFSVFLVKLSSDNILNTVAQVEKTWNKTFPNAAFDYFFLDDRFDNFYKEERQFAGVFRFFSFIGVVITCMGLFGLSAYNTNSRSKEIGIRKSVGASVKSIMWLFSREYFKLAVFSSAIGIPLGIWLLKNWLSNYPNRIGIEPDLIIVPFILTLIIALLTVGYQTFSAASANPVDSLRRD